MMHRLIRHAAVAGALLAFAFGPAAAQVVRQLTNTHASLSGGIGEVMDDAGTWVYFVATTEAFGDNPVAAYQLFRLDPTTGDGQRVSDIDGGLGGATVSDDGQWAAFTSKGDPKGQNQDRSSELFVMQTDGTRVNQLTHLASRQDGSVSTAVISGDGSTILFLSDADLGGLNPERGVELWTIKRDGTQLTRVTHMAPASFSFSISISDDGSRVVFESDGDPLGENPDGQYEIFAINADGTGLRQITHGTFPSVQPDLSGDGSTIVFQSTSDLLPPGNLAHNKTIYAVNWDGSALTQLTDGLNPGEYPAVTDDGQTIVFAGLGQHLPGQNSDRNQEIWSVGRDGTGMTQLTDTQFPIMMTLPEISGSGSRVLAAYLNGVPPWGHDPDGSGEFFTIAGDGSNPVQLLETVLYESRTPDITADGSRIVFAANGTLAGSTSDNLSKIFKIQDDGTGLTQITSFAGTAKDPAVSDDGQVIVFVSDGDPLGTNADGDTEIFAVAGDGTNLRQLTESYFISDQPAISGDGSLVALVSFADFDGTEGVTTSADLFVVSPTGGPLRRLTTGAGEPATRDLSPRLDRSGTWVVFVSTADLTGGNADGGWEVFRARTDGSLLEQITSSPDAASAASSPDISGDGRFISFIWNGDPLGTNADKSDEVFLYDTQNAALRQITDTASARQEHTTLTDDGRWVFFVSSAPLTGDAAGTDDVYRADTTNGEIDRVSAVMIYGGPTDRPAASADGSVSVWAKWGDETDTNYDLNFEVFIAKDAESTRLYIDRRSQGGIRWDPKEGALTYDAIRGDVANLKLAGGVVDLGPVHCLEDDSPDLDVEIFHDQEDPDPWPGGAIFYLHRPYLGSILGNETWGTASDGTPRQPGAGTCNP